MSNDNFDQDVPKVVLDDEDRQAYLRQRQQAGKTKAPPPASPAKPAKAPRSGAGVAWLAIFLALGAGGVGGWLYQLTQQQQTQLEAYQVRIADLEGRLSATGEEMGESTVALQVKVKELTEKTQVLWTEMDKLWGSAWRRNQAEIGDNKTAIEQMQTRYNNLNSATTNLKTSIDKATQQTATQVTNLQEMLSVQQLNQEATLESVSRLSSDANALQQQIANLTEKLSDANNNNSALLRRVNQLEQKVATLNQLIQGPTS